MSRGLIDKAMSWIADHTYKGYLFTSKVSLAGRTGSNYYTVPANGIVRLRVGYQAGSYCQVNDASANENLSMVSAPSGVNNVGPCSVTVPVFKGQKVNVNCGGTYEVYYIPYQNVRGGTA